MRKFLINIFSPLYKEIAGIQLKYQILSSEEVILRNYMFQNKLEIIYLKQILNDNSKLIDGMIDTDTIEGQNKLKNICIKIDELKTKIRYLKFNKENYEIKLKNLLHTKIIFENEHNEVFSKFNEKR